MSVGIGVLVSGSGTNLQAILDAGARGELGPGKVCVVLSNVPGAAALARAERAQVPCDVVPHRGYATRREYDAALVDRLRTHGAEVIALAGFMRLVSSTLLDAFPGRVVNIHPSLLPAFPGLHAQRQALEHGVKVSGCTVHLVDEGLDSGPILGQSAVPVHDDDDEATLTARILIEEHGLYPRVLRALVEGRILREASAPRRVRIIAPPSASGTDRERGS